MAANVLASANTPRGHVSVLHRDIHGGPPWTRGLDLPLKALVWQDADGQTQIACNDPQYIVRRHGLDAAFAANLAAVVPLIERAARG